jgi:DNA invertase Pin-like site-specific DNA recombinase/ribosomal protein L32
MKPKYFLYARKSTEDDDKQIMSIEAQLFELREFAQKENLKILAEFQESKSAKTPGRSIFEEMMTRIESSEANGVLAWHPDRLARNSIDGGRVIYAVDTEKLVSLRFPTFWFEPTPQGLFMLQVAFGQSKYYSDNLVQNVKRGIRQKLRRGEWLTKAPFGYVNNPRTRNIEPHPVNAKIVEGAFLEYLKGGHGLVSLSQYLADLGVVTSKNTPLAKCSIKHMLSNRAYLGFVRHYDEWFEGTFAPIISPSLFEAVQKRLASKAKPQKKRGSRRFPFCGLFRCGECGGMFSAQYAKGNGGVYRYYRCTKKKGICSQGYVQEKDLVAQIQKRLQTISLCDRYTEYMLKEIDKWEQEEMLVSHSDMQNLSLKIKASEARMEKLVSAYLDGDVPKEMYLKRKDETMRTTLALKTQKKDFEGRKNTWVEPLREWVMDTKQATFLSSSTDFSEIASFVQKIGTNHTVRDKTAHLSVPAPSYFVAERKGLFSLPAPSARVGSGLTSEEVLNCAPARNRTPLGLPRGAA